MLGPCWTRCATIAWAGWHGAGNSSALCCCCTACLPQFYWFGWAPISWSTPWASPNWLWDGHCGGMGRPITLILFVAAAGAKKMARTGKIGKRNNWKWPESERAPASSHVLTMDPGVSWASTFALRLYASPLVSQLRWSFPSEKCSSWIPRMLPQLFR